MISTADEIESVLVRRRLIEPRSRILPLAGNADRDPRRARSHWLIKQHGAPDLKLTVGGDLQRARESAAALSLAVPSFSAQEDFFISESEVDLWAVRAIQGEPAESLDRDGASAARLLTALYVLENEFARTEVASSAAALAGEWLEFEAELMELACWSEPDRAFLRAGWLDGLRDRLGASAVTRRWTNGDFTSGNIWLRNGGGPALFDSEYASLTHFFREDTVRFRRISPIALRHPSLFSGWWPSPTSEWEIYFQLRQLLLEQRENSVGYNAATTPLRKVAIRHFCGEHTEAFPSAWPAPLSLPSHQSEETAQLFWRGRDGHFREEDSARIHYRRGSRQLLAFRTPRSFTSWRLDPIAAERRVFVHSIVPVMASPNDVSPLSIPIRVVGARASTVDGATLLDPLGPDPQLHFSLPMECIGVVAELSCI